ncbi:hypothetical protein D3C80_1230320 [compost metagenome]
MSVWKCSSTTVNRSSRAKPWATFGDSGATATGFELYTISASIFGPNSGEASRSKSSPMVLMLMVRGLPLERSSERCNARKLTGKASADASRAPPAAWRQAPTRAGRQAILRTAMPPPRTRCKP